MKIKLCLLAGVIAIAAFAGVLESLSTSQEPEDSSKEESVTTQQ